MLPMTFYDADTDAALAKRTCRRLDDGADIEGGYLRSSILAHGFGSMLAGTSAHAPGAIGRAIQIGQDGIGHKWIFRGGRGDTTGDPKGRNPCCALYRPGRTSD